MAIDNPNTYLLLFCGLPLDLCLLAEITKNEVSYQVAFCQLWQDEVLLTKEILLIKDAKLLDQTSYSDFIAV